MVIGINMDVIMIISGYCPGICLENIRITTKNPTGGIPAEVQTKSGASLLHRPP
jgi:hypothetical protein